jgi:hypothetical protein
MSIDCRHLNARIEAGLMVPRGGTAEAMVRVEVRCPDCRQRLHFLGLPASWLPDAPHPEGSEDDGVNAATVYLPALWREGS